MAEIKREIESELSRELSLFQITMMGVGMMIGAGVFVGTGISIGKSGPGGLLIAFALNGLIALFTGMSYAELSSAILKTGGGYRYVREGFRGPFGFMTGWMIHLYKLSWRIRDWISWRHNGCGANNNLLGPDIQPKKILVPVAGGPHSPLALEIAGIMAAYVHGCRSGLEAKWQGG